MAENFSFDIVSKINHPELQNALNQARKEIDNRFDFKGSGSRIEAGTDTITVFSSDESKLRSIIEIIETRMVRREVPVEAVKWGEVADGPKGSVKREAKLIEGIDADKAREINKFARKLDKKVNVSIMQDQVRVSSKSKDALQGVLKAVKEQDFGLPLQFTNYR
jgi:cyclic-di-GMP-binding protein